MKESNILSPVSCLLSPVFYLLSPVSCLLSPVSCLLYPFPLITNYLSGLEQLFTCGAYNRHDWAQLHWHSAIGRLSFSLDRCQLSWQKTVCYNNYCFLLLMNENTMESSDAYSDKVKISINLDSELLNQLQHLTNDPSKVIEVAIRQWLRGETQRDDDLTRTFGRTAVPPRGEWND